MIARMSSSSGPSEIQDQDERSWEIPWWISYWRPEITVRPNTPDRFVEMKVIRPGATLRSVISREKYVRLTYVLVSVLLVTSVVVFGTFYYISTRVSVPLLVWVAIVGLVAFFWISYLAPQIWPFLPAKREE